MRDPRGAARSLRKALRHGESVVPEARYWLGLSMLRAGRTHKGTAQLERYLETRPGGRHAARARQLVQRPSCADERCLPPFSVRTTTGRRLESRELLGRVVLIEFWASWCPPCLEALPRLEQLGRRMEGRPFVAFGVNVDGDPDVLSRYVERHGLSWPQVWDEGRRLSRETFGVRSFPTILLADHRGTVRYSAIGWSAEIETTLEEALRRAVDDAGQDWQEEQ